MKSAVLFASILVLSGAPLKAAIILAVSPQSQTAPIGSVAQVQVAISGLGHGAAPSLGAYDLNIAFDPAILSFAGLTFGDPLQGDQLDLSGVGSIADVSSPSAGLLEFFEVSLDSTTLLDSLQSDRFVLTTLQFKTIAAGSSSLVPSLNSISDSRGTSLGVGLQSGRIMVGATPEPGTISMFALAAACFACFRPLRRLSQAQRPSRQKVATPPR